jgi:hypothetical protein
MTGGSWWDAATHLQHAARGAEASVLAYGVCRLALESSGKAETLCLAVFEQTESFGPISRPTATKWQPMRSAPLMPN